MTDNEMMNSTPTQTAFVYDRDTGEVVHVHQFVPAEPEGKCGDEEMEATAMRLAPSSLERGRLAILHEGPMSLNAEYLYRVDTETGRLITDRVPPNPVSG